MPFSLEFFSNKLPRLKVLALAAVSLFAGKAAIAQNTPQQVEITGKTVATRERQDDVGMRAIYGRDEIEKYGDTNLSEVLKRLPGISVSEGKGKGAEIRMRGLGNGYTQILLNGQATPVGFAIDSIAPDLIEKIEVMRVASADTGAQGIAGTINIILKKKSANQASEFKTNVSVQAGRLSGNATWSIADQAPAQWGDISYVLAGNAESNTTDVNIKLNEDYVAYQPASGQWQTLTSRQLQQTQQNRKDAISLSPRINWKIDTQNSLSWQGNINASRLEQAKNEQENSYLGSTTDFPINHSIWSAHILTSRNDLGWERRLDDSAKLSVTLGWNRLERDARFKFWGKDAQANLNEMRYVDGAALENEYRLLGKYLAPYSANHVISLGWEASHALRHENRIERDVQINTGDVANDVNTYQASLNKFAAYIQDEWSINKDWSAYLGLRWERIASGSRELGVVDGFDFYNVATMASPILQTVWKQSEQTQWRFALNRSFKLPSVANLVPRRFRIDNNNTPLNADFQGNPQLRPERAWGLEFAYEHYLSAASLVSANLYWRQIDDVIMEQLSQNNSSWLNVLSNNGSAKVIGLEIEAKAKLKELSSNMPDMELRATINRNWSKLTNVPGPDNHLSQQVPLLVSVGADYQLQPTLRLGGDYNFQAGNTARESIYLSGHSSPRRHLDIYLAWKQNQKSQLRFSVSNVLQQDKLDSDIYATHTTRWTDKSIQQSARTWRLVWEVKL
ncbi:TonB-dependent receptor [Undibacterium sp. TS12]|uniref:TonB-dependent receptor plug domain-containing protein n=1 Tax=Undibacterium sp. TS12 TaxID=2908202 RepID=UPI001F4D0CA4|nr:TonB-dependent receptor [Undibacterium sp. TS12]MCH8617766.1 TonB-dependent receptor [Undibacterium sp. TS12]